MKTWIGWIAWYELIYLDQYTFLIIPDVLKILPLYTLRYESHDTMINVLFYRKCIWYAVCLIGVVFNPWLELLPLQWWRDQSCSHPVEPVQVTRRRRRAGQQYDVNPPSSASSGPKTEHPSYRPFACFFSFLNLYGKHWLDSRFNFKAFKAHISHYKIFDYKYQSARFFPRRGSPKCQIQIQNKRTQLMCHVSL